MLDSAAGFGCWIRGLGPCLPQKMLFKCGQIVVQSLYLPVHAFQLWAKEPRYSNDQMGKQLLTSIFIAKKEVPLEGLEPPTVSLGRNCSSIELQRLAG